MEEMLSNGGEGSVVVVLGSLYSAFRFPFGRQCVSVRLE
jgi:hypothetical protein